MIMEDRKDKAIEVTIGHYEYVSGSVHRDVSEGEFGLLCMMALHSGGDRFVDEETYTILLADLIAADENEVQGIGMTMQ